ncbi:MAG TPA: DUF2339 domain-containing protein [Thermosynechococcus sp. M46_R2017_013]|nr:DUF2339 domain-containing protein [Thermosynechococcus sp. M46_R2017_013]
MGLDYGWGFCGHGLCYRDCADGAGLAVAAASHFQSVFAGGYYLTIFAAYQFLIVMPWGMAFPLMGAVTLGAFFISLRQNRAILAVIGVVGGLTTPLLLYSTDISCPLALTSYIF